MKMKFIVREDAAKYLGERPTLDSPESIEDFYRKVIEVDPVMETQKENLIVVCQNSRLRLIGYSIISVGTINETSFHPREVFRAAIAANSYGFTLVHNHPSGDALPSSADLSCTRKLSQASEIMGIRFFDHVIMGNAGEIPVGRESYYSFREAGII